ncbi:cytochrome P450 [Aspergillus udagawae]|nr:cytochrome P450 [Aspergillus udagawae]
MPPVSGGLPGPRHRRTRQQAPPRVHPQQHTCATCAGRGGLRNQFRLSIVANLIPGHLPRATRPFPPGAGQPRCHPRQEWSYDEIQAMLVLDAFVKEAQRMHSPSFQPARNVKKDVVLPCGWALPQGSILIPSIPHLHRHAAYRDNADRFDADRWVTEGVRNRHRSMYVPFAAGARGCIGFNVALQEVKVALAELVYRYEFVNGTDEAIEYDPDFIVIRPLNFYVRAIRRSSWPARSSA